jgi:hypothetical protein
MDPHSDQCAVGINGQLKDASDITWYQDPGDDDPLPSVLLDPVQQPEEIGHGGTRRSIRARKPTEKILAAVVPAARTSTTTTKRSAKQADSDLEDEVRVVSNEAMPSHADLSSNEERDDEDDEKSYAETKELGDQDRAVSVSGLSFWPC